MWQGIETIPAPRNSYDLCLLLCIYPSSLCYCILNFTVQCSYFFVSCLQAARYNFLSRSVRLGGKHNVRASILASSLSEVNLELHSFKGSSTTGPPSLVLHSSRSVDRFLCHIFYKTAFKYYVLNLNTLQFI